MAVTFKSAGNITTGTNFPMDGEGRVYHVACKKGEIANKIVIVGDPIRAEIVAKTYLRPDPAYTGMFPHTCSRGFTVYTGFYKDEDHRVSIAAIGMGVSMVDFFVREVRAIVDGQIDIIRLGSCGTPQDDITVGTVVAADFAFGIYDDHRPYEERAATETKYEITKAVYPDPHLHEALVTALEQAGQERKFTVRRAGCAATESFYSSQARQDAAFPDDNEDLPRQIFEKHPKWGSTEMESSKLFDLATMNTAVADPGAGIRAAACNIVLAERREGGAFLTVEAKRKIEKDAGVACLNALFRV